MEAVIIAHFAIQVAALIALPFVVRRKKKRKAKPTCLNCRYLYMYRPDKARDKYWCTHGHSRGFYDYYEIPPEYCLNHTFIKGTEYEYIETDEK